MKKVTLTNSFHNTSCAVMVPDAIADLGQSEIWNNITYPLYTGSATPAQKARIRRIERTLCGSNDCTCGVVR